MNLATNEMGFVEEVVIDAEFAEIVRDFETERTAEQKFAEIVDDIDDQVSPELKETLESKVCGKTGGMDLQALMKK